MSRAGVTLSRLRGLVRRARTERALDDEVRFHIEAQIEDNVRAGMTAEQARQAALRSFGGVELMKENYRDCGRFAFAETIAQDVRFAIRTLRRSPGFTITCVAVLALGIGANTAMFSVLHAVLLRPLPYRSPEQLAMLWTEIPGQSAHEVRSAYADAEAWKKQSISFADMAVFDPASVTLTTSGEGEQITAGLVSQNFFSLLGVQALRGRVAGDHGQAVISYRFWQARFGGANTAIGANLEIDGEPVQVIGILPSDFRFAQLDADVWEPEVLSQTRGGDTWFVIGRLRPGSSIEQAQAEMSTIAQRLDAQAPVSRRGRGVRVVPLHEQITGPQARLALWMLSGAVFGVLLIAATNIASLSLARSAEREREIAVRAALGASRTRIARQLLAESTTLAVLAGALGLLVARVGIRAILATRPGNLARLDEIGLAPPVLACALGLCLLTGVLVGLAPALTMARRKGAPSLQESGRNAIGGTGVRRTRRLLVVTEFALAIMLLAGAGLLLRSLWSVEAVDPGFRAERVLSLQVASPDYAAAEQRTAFYNRTLDEVAALAGVESAGVIGDLFIGNYPPQQTVSTDGGARTISGLRRDEVSNGFFRTIGTPLLKGRFFLPQDGPNAPRMAIVNDVMAQRLWPGRDPVGQRFRVTSGEFTVCGVVGNLRRQGLEYAPVPQMFVPLAQAPSRHAVLLVRTRGSDPLSIAAAVQAAVRRVEPRAVLYGVAALESQLGDYLEERRFQTWLLIGFSLVALAMAAIGIYGLIRYSIVTRTREIGIRVAVGAEARDIFCMILGEGMRLSLTGLAIGLIGALCLGRLVSRLLFGVTVRDPLTFVSISGLLLTVSVAACYFPARRAMKIDPMAALRQE